MTRTSAAEEAILLASDNAAAADYLVRRGEAKNSWFSNRISEETEATLLERNDRLVNLRLAEYCLYPATAHTLLQRDPTDWPLRSLVLANEKIAQGLILRSFPACLFGSDEGLRAFLAGMTPDDVSVLFSNPTIGDNFLENVLKLDDCWNAMPEAARLFALSSLANNPKIQRPVDEEDHADGYGWFLAGRPFNAAWRLVIELEPNAETARHLSELYDRLAPYCLQRDGIREALSKWIPQNEGEQEEEGKDNERGSLSAYQRIRRAVASMTLQESESKQGGLLNSEDIAVRCGAYLSGRFSPDEVKAAIERDGWLAVMSLMENPKCWRTSDHREALSEGFEAEREKSPAGDRDIVHWEFRRCLNKFSEEHPEWFDFEEASPKSADKPLTENSAVDLFRQFAASPAFNSINVKVESLVQAKRTNFWLLVAILAALLFRR